MAKPKQEDNANAVVSGVVGATSNDEKKVLDNTEVDETSEVSLEQQLADMKLELASEREEKEGLQEALDDAAIAGLPKEDTGETEVMVWPHTTGLAGAKRQIFGMTGVCGTDGYFRVNVPVGRVENEKLRGRSLVLEDQWKVIKEALGVAKNIGIKPPKQ